MIIDSKHIQKMQKHFAEIDTHAYNIDQLYTKIEIFSFYFCNKRAIGLIPVFPLGLNSPDCCDYAQVLK